MNSTATKITFIALLGILTLGDSAKAQSLIGIHATPTDVVIDESIDIVVSFKRQGVRNGACGLRVNFGDGTSEHMRAEERFLPVMLTHTYKRAGDYVVTADGKAHIDGLRSVFGCFGEDQSLTISVRPKVFTEKTHSTSIVTEQISTQSDNTNSDSVTPTKQVRPITRPTEQTTSEFLKLQSENIVKDGKEKDAHQRTDRALPAPTSTVKATPHDAIQAPQAPTSGRFDCALASTRIENAICASQKLSQLDGRLGEIYSTVLLMHSSPDAVRAAQRKWLTGTRNQCADAPCLISVYEQRIAALIVSLPKDTQNAIADAEQEDKADSNFEQQELAKQKEEQATAIVKKQSDDAAEQAKKQAEEAAALEKQRAQDSEAQATKKQADDAVFWINVKGSVGLTFFIAMIVYAVIQRKKKKNGTQTEREKSNDLNKSISSILTETHTKVNEDRAAITQVNLEPGSFKSSSESIDDSNATPTEQSALVATQDQRNLAAAAPESFDFKFSVNHQTHEQTAIQEVQAVEQLTSAQSGPGKGAPAQEQKNSPAVTATSLDSKFLVNLQTHERMPVPSGFSWSALFIGPILWLSLEGLETKGILGDCMRAVAILLLSTILGIPFFFVTIPLWIVFWLVFPFMAKTAKRNLLLKNGWILESEFAARFDPSDPSVDRSIEVRCPACKEIVRKDARICKHCRTELTSS